MRGEKEKDLMKEVCYCFYNIICDSEDSHSRFLYEKQPLEILILDLGRSKELSVIAEAL
jgi:hypothetical protein